MASIEVAREPHLTTKLVERPLSEVERTDVQDKLSISEPNQAVPEVSQVKARKVSVPLVAEVAPTQKEMLEEIIDAGVMTRQSPEIMVVPISELKPTALLAHTIESGANLDKHDTSKEKKTKDHMPARPATNMKETKDKPKATEKLKGKSASPNKMLSSKESSPSQVEKRYPQVDMY